MNKSWTKALNLLLLFIEGMHWSHDLKTSLLLSKMKSVIYRLFTIAKTRKQPKCPSADEWIKKMWYMCSTEYYSAIKKEWNNAICSNMDGPRDYHSKWSKLDRERTSIWHHWWGWFNCSVMSNSVRPMDCSPPGSSVHGILQAKILDWVAISFSRGSSQPQDRTWVSCIGRWIRYHWATRESPFNFILWILPQ